MSNANTRQVGGEHYKSEYQHWDFVHDMALGYFEGQITKYISRHRRKNGAQDVQKAIHFATKLRELAERNRRSPVRSNPNVPLIEAYIRGNQLTPPEGVVIRSVCNWSTALDLAELTARLYDILEGYDTSAHD